MPAAVAIKFVIVNPAVAAPIFNKEFVPFVNVPAPANVVLTVSPCPNPNPCPILFVQDPLMLKFAIVSEVELPFIFFAAPLRVSAPVPELNMPLFVKLPAIVIGLFAEFENVPLLVKSPVKVFVPVVLLIAKVPAAAIVVAPVTVSDVVNAPKVRLPEVTVKVPEIVVVPAVFANDAPLTSLSSMFPKVLVAPVIVCEDEPP